VCGVCSVCVMCVCVCVWFVCVCACVRACARAPEHNSESAIGQYMCGVCVYLKSGGDWMFTQYEYVCVCGSLVK